MYVPGVVGVPVIRLPFSVSPSGRLAAWKVIGCVPGAVIVYAEETPPTAETVNWLVKAGVGNAGAGPKMEKIDVLPDLSVIVAVRFWLADAVVSIFQMPATQSLRPSRLPPCDSESLKISTAPSV